MPPALYRLDSIRSDGLTFADCIAAAIETPELVAQFDRLWNALWEYVFTRVEKTELPPEKAAEVRAFAKEHNLPFMAVT